MSYMISYTQFELNLFEWKCIWIVCESILIKKIILKGKTDVEDSCSSETFVWRLNVFSKLNKIGGDIIVHVTTQFNTAEIRKYIFKVRKAYIQGNYFRVLLEFFSPH